MTKWPNAAIIAIFIAAMVAVTGCARQPQQVQVVEDTSGPRGGITGQLGDGVWVYQDPDTGCEYLVTHKGGIAPRMEDKGGASGLINPQKGCAYDINRE